MKTYDIYIIVMQNNNLLKHRTNMERKRKYRQMSDETKQKISRSLKGKTKTQKHKENISKGLKRYWGKVPNRPDVEQK